ncbi:MAG: hypothetical protein U0935_04710 [Pirellulales bacterium]
MPATEQTWRNQKLLHRIFGAVALSLLGATMWMFYADHDREWKGYQDTARHMDLSYNTWLQLQHQTNAAVREHEVLARSLALARTSPLSDELLRSFRAEAERRAPIDPTSQEMYESLGIERLNQDAAAAAAQLGSDPAQATSDAIAAAERAHDRVVKALQDIVDRAKFHEDNALNARKFKSADLDAIRAKLDIAVRDNRSEEERANIQAEVTRVASELEQLKRAYQEAATHRQTLLALVRSARTGEDAAQRALDENQAELRKLKSAYGERQMTYFADRFPWLGKKWLTLPILDAFNSPRKIDNLWSDDLTIDYNFRRVRRFDRCTTCHQAMEKTQPGTSDQPLFDTVEQFSLLLATPTKEEVQAARKEVADQRDEREKAGETLVTTLNQDLLEKLFGLRLAVEGLVARDDVTVALVLPKSRAASAAAVPGDTRAGQATGQELRQGIIQTVANRAADVPPTGLALGDTIVRINGNDVDDPLEVERMLLTTADFGKPLELLVRRGFAQPYASHPRLDLYISSASPHRMQTFACTVCHEGQGSATQFKWASHTPDTTRQQEEWSRDHGWFDNAHWIFPMYARRFAESACLKCHHEVVELEPSERFPDPPAPSLTHGYHLLRKYGCYGCHEIKGYDGPARRLGPDMRLEPNYFAAAQQLRSVLTSADAWTKLTAEEQSWVQSIIDSPEKAEPRLRLLARLTEDAQATAPVLPADAHRLAGLLKDEETPGNMRKPGPSLRFLAAKADAGFLADWIREPKHFRGSTRMPQFFELWQHLDGPGRDVARKYEAVEISGMVSYLREHSQQFEYLTPATVQEPAADNDEARQAARVERGKVAFQERGCLACHTHAEFPDVAKYRRAGEIVQGPDLTGLGSKFAPSRNPDGRKWLYSWIKQPTKYHPRTVMPDLYLDPVQHKDDKGKVVAITDPVADIVDYLMTSQVEGWQPQVDQENAQNSLDSLVLENLQEAFYETAAQDYLKKGIPASLEKTLKGAERELVVTDAAFQAGEPLTEKQKLSYIGRKSIAKYGCFGCHDIPGFEDAKPIGTGLADWGRKEPAKLAFEHITHYLHGHAHGPAGHGAPQAGAAEHGAAEHGAGDSGAGSGHGAAAHDAGIPEFYLKHIESGHREGFLWQKLAEPRSYDFEKTGNKRYNERLRMPQFPFTGEDREAVMTFVLGLVSDPPATKYLYRPAPDRQAWIKGRQVLDKYNCAGCHVLRPEAWNVAFAAGEMGEQAQVNQYPYLSAHFSSAEIAASAKSDSAGRVHTRVTGMPALNDADAQPVVYDVEGDPVDNDGEYPASSVSYPFDLWQPALIEGHKYEPGVMQLNLPASKLMQRYPAEGGVLARYLLPHVIKREKQVNPAAKGTESWAWVPPPLVGEGAKVQSDWLHSFLLNPYPIRPAVVLRMPRFNMSSQEAAELAEYFARQDGVEYPYTATEQRKPDYLAAKDAAYQQQLQQAGQGDKKRDRLQDALRIVTNSNYCVKCHLVGDFEPPGGDRAKAPNLARLYERMRPGYLRDWIANPKRILPYTSMPINIPYDPADTAHFGGISQDLFHGTSIEQVDALVDLLMNYDNYAKRQALVAPLVQQAAPPPAAANPAAPGDAKPDAAAKD